MLVTVTPPGRAVARPPATLDLAGNALCLDFANTVDTRLAHGHDYLGSYPDLLLWSAHAGALPTSVTRRLRAEAGTPAAARALAGAHRLRDTVYAVFSAIAAQRRPSTGDLGALGTAYGTATGHAAIARDGGSFVLTWPATGPDTPLWPVARSAGDLLLAGPLERVGECPGCGWLFLDVSRNGGRRWCSMDICGSRDKMARYHQRQRARSA